MEYWYFLRVISRRKWLIIFLIVVSLAGTFASIKFWPTPVEAKTTILFNFKTPRDVDVFDNKTYLGPKDTVEHYNFMVMFSSPSVVGEALDNVSKEVELGKVDVKRVLQRAKATLSLIKVGGLDEKTSVVEYTVSLQDPVKAVAICKEVSRIAIERYKNILTESVVRSRKYLEEQVLVAREEVDKAQTALEQYYVDNPEFTRYLDRSTYSGETVRSESNAIDIEVQLASMNIQIANVKKEIELYTKNPSDQIPVSILTNPLINDLRSELFNLQVERDQLLTRYKENFPQVVKINSEITEIRGNLYATYLTLLNENLKSLETKRDELNASLSSIKSIQNESAGAYNEFSVKNLQFDGLNRNLSIAEENYRLMTEKLTEARIREDEAHSQYTLSIIDQPQSADQVFPKEGFFYNPIFKMLFAFFGSIVFTLALVFLMDYFESRFKVTTDVSAVLGLPILAEIPEYSTKK